MVSRPPCSAENASVPFFPDVRDRLPREIQRVTLTIGDHLYHVGIVDLPGVFDPLLERRHDHRRIVHQRQNRRVDGGGVDQRFVALNVDDNFSTFRRRRFRHAVRARNVVCSRHPHRRPKTSCDFAHSRVICGNNRACQVASLGRALVHVLQHGFRGNEGQNLAGKTGRGNPGGNYAQNFTRHMRSYHSCAMLNLDQQREAGTL